VFCATANPTTVVVAKQGDDKKARGGKRQRPFEAADAHRGRPLSHPLYPRRARERGARRRRPAPSLLWACLSVGAATTPIPMRPRASWA
jgi:hypothetical protein